MCIITTTRNQKKKACIICAHGAVVNQRQSASSFVFYDTTSRYIGCISLAVYSCCCYIADAHSVCVCTFSLSSTVFIPPPGVSVGAVLRRWKIPISNHYYIFVAFEYIIYGGNGKLMNHFWREAGSSCLAKMACL